MELSREELLEAYRAGHRDFSGLDLREINLRYRDLRDSDLRDSDLRDSDLRGCNLRGSDLRGSDLRGSDLCCSYLRGCKLEGIRVDKNTRGYFMVCPEKGEFIGYKKCRDDRIVTLKIPEDAKRSSATTRKCRCSKAVVLNIESIDGSVNYIYANSRYNIGFIYEIGETVEVEDFCEDRWEECAPGIHFFMTREEAVLYR